MPNWQTEKSSRTEPMADANSAARRQFSNPYVFVVGCPRSGTTLLQRMLDNHPQLTVANDTHFITRAAKHILRENPQPAMTPELLEAVKSYRRTYRMGLDDNAFTAAAEHCDTYAAFVSRLYTLRGKMKNKPLSGEKTPDYCRQMPALHALFPDTRFVHIIRDGRNTTLSTLNWASGEKGPGKWSLWHQDPLATCALWWRWQVGIGQKQGKVLGASHYLQVRYEELVANPVNELTSIARFLDLAYSDDMANYHDGKTRKESGLSAKAAWLPPVQGLRDWRQEMSAGDIRVFEGIAGNLLRANGYECHADSCDEAVSARVQRALQWWEAEGMT